MPFITEPMEREGSIRCFPLIDSSCRVVLILVALSLGKTDGESSDGHSLPNFSVCCQIFIYGSIRGRQAVPLIWSGC